jgi:hypothetical protein
MNRFVLLMGVLSTTVTVSPLLAQQLWPGALGPALAGPGSVINGSAGPTSAATIVRGQDFDEALTTDRPDFTESSSVVGRCRLQIEGGYTYLHDAAAGVETDEHLLPELLLRYGLNDCLELRVG